MKSFNLIVILIFVFSLSSCFDFSNDHSNKSDEEKETTIVNDSTKKNAQEKGSLINKLIKIGETLSAKVDSTQNKVDYMSNKLDELNNYRYISIASIVLSLIAIFIALTKRKGITKEQEEEEDIIKDYLNESGIAFSLNNLNNIEYKLRSIESRMDEIEKKLKKLKKNNKSGGDYPNPPTPTPTPTPPNPPCPPPYPEPLTRIGYAKIDTDNYFTTIYDSQIEGCAFSISFTSKEEGRFNLISLDKIQSSNDWDKKVVCSGCSISEASDFQLEEEGLCKKIDEVTWKVVKPLKIKLLK